MVEETGRLHVLVERVIAIKEQLDELGEGGAAPVHAHPPASFDVLVQVRRLFEARRLATPRDYERVLRAHDGIDHVWRAASGASASLFGHRALLAQRAGGPGDAAASEVVIAASADGDRVALVPGPTDLPALVARNPGGRAVARFPSVTAWLEWISAETSAELDRQRALRRASPAPHLSRSP